MLKCDGTVRASKGAFKGSGALVKISRGSEEHVHIQKVRRDGDRGRDMES